MKMGYQSSFSAEHVPTSLTDVSRETNVAHTEHPSNDLDTLTALVYTECVNEMITKERRL